MEPCNVDMNEEDVKTFYIDKVLDKKGWLTPDRCKKEYSFTDGRIFPNSFKLRRQKKKRADYVLFNNNQLIAYIEAKNSNVPSGTGMQQAIEYAKMLHAPFLYSCNGKEFVEKNMKTNLERVIALDDFPTFEQLLEKVQKDYFNYTDQQFEIINQPLFWDEFTHTPRYYQRNAINSVLKAIADGQKRILLVMATGTGKTFTAFQIIHCLRRSKKVTRVLYLADRNILIDQTINQDFAPFVNQKKLTKIVHRKIDKGYEIYMALYQQFYDAKLDNDKQPYHQFDKDFFDLVFIDECHRGSARADSEWHKILEYFSNAIQIGLTATPRQKEDSNNIEYFNEPVYEYSLRQGIEDGFLAPYMVTKIDIKGDDTGYIPEKDETDLDGKSFDNDKYTKDKFGKKINIEDRDMTVAQRITQMLHSIGRMKKTIVFCNSDLQADIIRRNLINLNADMVKLNPNYIMRITSSDTTGKKFLNKFISVNSTYPVVATTVDLLATGVDCKTCGLVVINQQITDTARFKQIVGRGTRLKEDKNKWAFHILDFYNATDLIQEDFDGDTIIYDLPTDETPTTKTGHEDVVPFGTDQPINSSDNDDNDNGGNFDGDFIHGLPEGTDETPGDGTIIVDPKPLPVVYRVKGKDIRIIKEQVFFWDENGKRVVSNYIVYAKSKILNTYKTLQDFLQNWEEADKKSAIVEELKNNGVFIDEIRKIYPDFNNVDIFDIVCNIAYQKPFVTRLERAEKVKVRKFYKKYKESAQQVVEALIEKYANNGILELENKKTLDLEPFKSMGSVLSIIKMFGNKQNYDSMIKELEKEIYVA